MACTEADLASVASVSKTLLPPYWRWANTDFQHSNWNEINYFDQERIVNVGNARSTEFCLMLRHFTSFFSTMRQGKKEKKKGSNIPSKLQCETKPKQDFGTLKKGFGSDNDCDFWCVHTICIWLSAGSEVWDPQQTLLERGTPCIVMENLKLFNPFFFYLASNADNPDGKKGVYFLMNGKHIVTK